jgi:antitoxin component of MazEF toxin-antitoxin module
MRARVSKWGNSLAVRLPHAAVESLHVHEGEQVELSIKDDRLQIRSPSRAIGLTQSSSRRLTGAPMIARESNE